MTIQTYTTYIDGSKTFNMLLTDDKIIGGVACRDAFTKVAHIADLYIDPKHRGNGYARELFMSISKWMIEYCPINYLYLYVDENNPMKETYQNYGFRKYKYQGKYKVTPSGKYWMRKKVNK